MRNNIDIQNRSKIESQICGAIKCAIDAHGPITRENVSSAAKRVYEQLKNIAAEQRKTDKAARDWAMRNLLPGN